MEKNNTPFNGPFDDTISAPAAPIEPNRQPPNIQTLTAISGKTPNAVKVEYEKKLRDINADQMKNPPNMLDNEQSPQAMARIQAFNELEKEYESGEAEEEESDEVTYDDLVGDISTDMGQDPAAESFSMFAPAEQDMANQMFSDIDSINAEEPTDNTETEDPFDMDDLSKIAEPEESTSEGNNLDWSEPTDESDTPPDESTETETEE